MNILMTSVFFYPHIGGIETVTEYLAEEFTRKGHTVTVVTATAEQGEKEFPFKVLRRPTTSQLWQVYKQSDVFVHQGISLKWVWPLLLKRKPWFIVYHGVYYQPGILGKLKKLCSYFAHNIAVSETTKKGYALRKADVILNSYNDKVYKYTNSAIRRDFVYVGKLYVSKGLYILLDAFEKFKSVTASNWRLTIVGGGNSEVEIKEYASHLSCSQDIDFVGFKYPRDVVDILNQHAVQIVPSLNMEAFGVVVLEGMACGCVVVGSDGDGISEAMGEVGFTFNKGDADSLFQAMLRVSNLTPDDIKEQQLLAKHNLAKLSLSNVAQRYLDVFSRVINN